MNNNLILDYNEKPRKKRDWFFLSFQHVFAMFSATVLVPMLTGLDISVALFASGVGTLIYILCTKARVPIYLGSSFAYIAYINSAMQLAGSSDGPNYGAAFTGILIVGIIYVIVALIIKFVGVKWLHKLLPPVVVGPMIIIIGLGLASTAVGQIDLVEGGDWRNIVIAISTMLFVALFALKGKGFMKIIPFLLGILGGYLVALALNWVSDTPVFVNGQQQNTLEAFIEVVKNPSQWFTLPSFKILGWKDANLFANVSMVKFSLVAAVGCIPLAFVTISEHIGDHKVLGKITGYDYMTEPGLHRTLLGDGIATMFAGAVGGPANTSYGENTSVVGMTKIGSVWVTGGAAVVAILLSFCNLFTTLIATIPSAVMGGVCLILYGFIASNGLKTIFDAKVDLTSTRNMIIVSVMLVIGLGGAVIKIGDFGKFSGMALAMIFGIVLNFILPKEVKKAKKDNTELSEDEYNLDL